MDYLMHIASPSAWGVIIFVSFFAGIVKGVVGFSMPMVMISGLGSVMPAELAIAGMILPALVTNLWQALRQGPKAAWEAIRRFRVFLLAGVIVLVFAAQLVAVLPQHIVLLMIGVPITLFAVSSLLGRPLRFPPNPSPWIEGAIGGVTGFFGGISGVWGATTVAMLTAQDLDKHEQMRIQGVIFGLGGVALMFAHMASGVFRQETAPLSAFLVVPAVIGIGLGFSVQDRIDQSAFRRMTLVVLLIAGANLIRRGLMG
ncbi:sulfite exporter TauE/SafE family protein [Roseovarius sp. A21]|uniref:Probable membrane transporter protein n=1 Tax=Roseovarius bejariae TaxID=2576383 RepID=A0A844CXX7_9RHOB|nr:sulfite exporter TauE/SafE family protein [Roseovarius bejariae]MRU15966.1 sulfite exporter TauE/SafE family protein [Roseovarius bejariae]